MPGQRHVIDSLKQLVDQSTRDSVIALNLCRIAEAYIDVENDSAILYYNKSAALANKITFDVLECVALRSLGHTYIWKKDQYKLGLQSLQKGLDLARMTKDTLEQIRTLSQIGSCYHKQGKTVEALRYYLQESELAKNINDPFLSCIAYLNIGVTYSTNNDHETANQYYNKALGLAKVAKSLSYEALLLNNIAHINFKLKQHEIALIYLEEAEALLREEKNYQVLYLIQLTKGQILIEQGKIEEGITCYETARDHNTFIGSKENEAFLLLYLSKAQKKIGEYSQSIASAKKSLEIYETINVSAYEEELHALIAQNYDLLNKHIKANEYYRKLTKSYTNKQETDQARKIVELQFDNEIRKRDNEILSLQNEDLNNKAVLMKSNLQLQLMSLILAVLVLVVGLFFYINKSRQLKRINNLKNRLSDDLHDNIGASLNHIKMLSNQLSRNTISLDEKDNTLFKIKSISNNLMYTMYDLVWALNGEQETIGDLLVKIQDYTDNTLSDFNIPYQFQVEKINEKRKLSTKEKLNIYAIFKESINNILKHTETEHIDISIIKKQEKNFKLSIKNKYKNKKESNNHSNKNGISNMKKRAKELNGQLQILNQENYFTLIFSW